MSRSITIAIDGYSSCGKSTVARDLAKAIGIRYIDSGAMYRAVTLFFLRNEVPIPESRSDNNSFDYNSVLNDIDITFRINEETDLADIFLNGENVSDLIREMVVSENVSRVSTIKSVRKKLVMMQQNLDKSEGIVMDGRDIGTHVFPDADLKIFMTADVNTRAERRFAEMVKKNPKITREVVMENLNQRDTEDKNRTENPLVRASDAILLDSTNLDRDQQLEFILSALKTKELI